VSKSELPGKDALGSADLGLLDENLGPVVRQLRNHLSIRIIHAFERFGLRTGSYSTMALIAAKPGCAQSEIARETGVDKSVVVALVDALERGGLAMRIRSREDRRRNVLTLTDAGHTLLKEMNAVAREVERPARDALTEDELKMLIRLNRKALQALLAAEGR
jgi:DNA-binding MarR family transcriptional regulator